MLLTTRRLGSEGNPRGFHLSLSQWIVDALVVDALGSGLRLFVVFIIPRFIIPHFGHVYLQAQSAACQGRVRHKQGRACHSHGQSHSASTGSLRSRSWAGAVCGPSQLTQRRSITRYNVDQRRIMFAGQRCSRRCDQEACLVSRKILAIFFHHRVDQRILSCLIFSGKGSS